jgi:Sortase domain
MPAPGRVGPRGASAAPTAAAISPSGTGTVPTAPGRIGRRPSAWPGPGGRSRRTLVALAVAGLVLGGCGGRPSGRPAAPGPTPTRDPGAAAGSFDAPGLPPRAPGFEVGGLPRQLAAPGRAAAPVRLAIPAIGVATRLVRLGLEADGGMQVPEDFDRAGWFAEGPVPGQLGPAVIAGHVDSRSGPAVFHRLRDLRPGDAVLVELADGARLRFLVEQAGSFPKAGFPTAAVFGPVPSAALRLVTCAGDFDRARGSYRDNLVVFARLAAVGR